MSDYDLLSEDFLIFLYYLYNTGFVIVTPALCAIGLILNIICFIVFLSLEEKIFFYLAIKSFAESLLLAFGAISPYTTCTSCNLENNYSRALINLITQKYSIHVIYLLITILEIDISFNRYFLISSRHTNILIQTRDKIKILFYILTPVIIFLPYFFAFNIEKKQNNEYHLEYNIFGNSKFFYYFFTYFVFLEYILSILILIPLNIITLIKFKKFVKRKSQNVNRTIRQVIINANNIIAQENLKAESRFTKMICIISFLFLFSRLCEASVLFFIMYDQYVRSVDYFLVYYNILIIFVNANTYIIFSLNFFIFYFLNEIFRNKFKQIFCCKK